MAGRGRRRSRLRRLFCMDFAFRFFRHCAESSRFRFRNIQQMPNHCGRLTCWETGTSRNVQQARPCKPMDAKEAGACHSKCAAWLHSCLGMEDDTRFGTVICSEENPLFCAWTYWSTRDGQAALERESERDRERERVQNSTIQSGQ